ncbi:GTPase family protein [Merismopedia glauca]|uniref:GTP-binding protein n=1 Tax=Merismopedia glauca CCAP 1448/3 TaxID=1296344 RepID=A0A2T1C5Z8_9CYAN|nr:GTPase [Merismopedia glauca]PSB03666.1 GTP-binding protein [Merismopedia glauca CCAP 1448/3]
MEIFNNSSPFNFDKINNRLKEERGKLGRVNVLLVGKTGCGKSTLVNAVFGKNMVAVGVGKPVTQGFEEIRDVSNGDKSSILGLFDSKGLELEGKEYESILEKLEKFIQQKADNVDSKDHIHIAWLCIDEGSRRVQEAEIRAARMLAKYMPVIAVITKSYRDKSQEYDPVTQQERQVSFKERVVELLPVVKEVVRVKAILEEDDDGKESPPKGLKDLVEATVRLIPDAHKKAFIAAQKVDLSKKAANARLTTVGFALLAGGAAVAPANLAPPGGHAVLLVTEQVTMFASISLIFGLDIARYRYSLSKYSHNKCNRWKYCNFDWTGNIS